MATSPNFSWPEPDNTDLVKNGALAIRTAINAIDTSMVDLKGGTTGQVLSKASATDMDFSWVTDATGIPATIFDAKGDIIAATAADTAGRLAVGTNGQTLVADSSTATGLKWATPSSGGSMTLLSTTTLSGATTTISSIDQTYKNLYVRVSNAGNATGNGAMRCKINTTFATYWAADTVAGATRSTGQDFSDYLQLSGNVLTDRTLTNYTEYIIQIFNYATTTMYFKNYIWNGAYVNSSGVNSYVQGRGIMNYNAGISQLEFSNSGGNLNNGTVYVYGVN